LSISQIEAAVRALGEVREQVIFLGGASIALWLTDPAGRPLRVTDDVDVIAEVATLAEYENFQAALRRRGFAEDIHSGVIVRWRHEELDVVLDAVPAAERLAGFSDRWLQAAIAAAVSVELPSGADMRAVPPAWLVVLKLEAFNDRGNEDCLSSRDFEDIVLLLDAREELLDELDQLPPDAKRYVRKQLMRIRGLPTFAYGFEGAIGGVDSRARMDAVTFPRLERLLQILEQ
jgi:hypothetical protein